MSLCKLISFATNVCEVLHGFTQSHYEVLNFTYICDCIAVSVQNNVALQRQLYLLKLFDQYRCAAIKQHVACSAAIMVSGLVYGSRQSWFIIEPVLFFFSICVLEGIPKNDRALQITWRQLNLFVKISGRRCSRSRSTI